MIEFKTTLQNCKVEITRIYKYIFRTHIVRCETLNTYEIEINSLKYFFPWSYIWWETTNEQPFCKSINDRILFSFFNRKFIFLQVLIHGSFTYDIWSVDHTCFSLSLHPKLIRGNCAENLWDSHSFVITDLKLFMIDKVLLIILNFGRVITHKGIREDR